jgi:DNA-directed RNA polymerase subunit RPC12/RpoP
MLTRNDFVPHLTLPQAMLTAKKFRSPVILLCVLLLASVTACKKDVSLAAIDTDANGYICLKCGAKFYTERTVFLGASCPQCKQEGLIQAVGFYCEKDHYLTIRAGQGDRQGAVCEKCQAFLINAMKAPLEKDLKAWGATKIKG